MIPNRLCRTLSAFNRSTRLWAPVLSRRVQSPVTQTLSLVTWNIDAFSSRPLARSKLILKHILNGSHSPDIIFLQEVSPEARDSILNDPRVRAAFLATDAEDSASFQGVAFATMTLLSTARFASGLDPQKEDDWVEEGDGVEGGEKFALGPVFRVTLPSNYGRDALCVDIIPRSSPRSVLRLINVHLDSLENTFHHRTKQMEILANVLREPGCGGGLIAGDFNAISPRDHELVGKNGLEDAWVALYGKEGPDGATWGVGVERENRLGPGRLDKAATMGLKAMELEILHPGRIEIPRPASESLEIPWSDHCGLRCTFTVGKPVDEEW
ncbi:hypothetical protein C0991_005874 [Blastosporella zonata]|nr:hypothetical protein C0991_005874 [Blastosporella zonata]